jgi:hypothetical protein
MSPRSPSRCVRAACGLALALLLPAAAHAWGAEGHRIVARVAEQLLDARTRAALRDIAGDETLEEASTWLDRERQHLRRTLRGSPGWHYDDRPVCDADQGAEQYCADGNCASRAYDRYVAKLGNAHASREERLLALHVVAHLVGDAHQPLHAADHGDRGGNQVLVLLGSRTRATPLHTVWDKDFVKRAVRGSSEDAFARRLIDTHRADLSRIERGGFAAWMGESYAIARDYAYGRLPGFACSTEVPGVLRLSTAYVDGANPIVQERLARAGIRLAAVLRAALGTSGG